MLNVATFLKTAVERSLGHSLSLLEHGFLQRGLYTITLKMADQGWSDLHVVFTMILCGAKFCIW